VRVVDLEPRDLPYVRVRDARALTRAARLLAGLPARLEAPLGELGSIVVAREGVHALEATAGSDGDDVVLGLTRAAGAGRLVVDGELARHLVALALGGKRRAGVPLARLGLAERGVVAGLAASALQAFGAPFSVSLGAPGIGAIASEGGVALALAVTVGPAAGWARVELPESWFAAAPATSVPALGTLEVEARVELARTRLSAGELAGLAAGDAVVFDGEPGLAGGGFERPVRVVVGTHAARARLADDGRVAFEDVLRPSAQEARGGLVEGFVEDSVGKRGEEEVGMDAQSGDGTAALAVDTVAVLAAAPVEVVAEVGRLVLRGDELAGLGPGTVLTVGRMGASPVALRVGGEVWAEGELVDVEGELGVRVTTLRRPGPR
jgi:type III secretion system YscQ/HrcQ family protein